MPGEDAKAEVAVQFREFRQWLEQLHSDNETRMSALEAEQAAFREIASQNRELAQSAKERLVAVETTLGGIQTRMDSNGFVTKRVCQAYHEGSDRKIDNLEKRFWAVLMMAVGGLGGVIFLLARIATGH